MAKKIILNKVKEIQNVSKKKPEEAIVRKPQKIEPQVYRVRQDIAKWRSAVTMAESPTNPNRYYLYQLYLDLVIDAHLSASIQQRKNLILGKDYCVYNKDGSENEEKTLILRQSWFIEFLDMALDSIYYGHSLVQFGDLENDVFKLVELVPRMYVRPEFHLVTDDPMSMQGQDYLESPYKEWCIGIGKPKDLGLLMKVAPLIIWKKNALGAWAEYVEVFGTPIRIGKTNTRDLTTTTNMENMLKNMGVSAYGLFDLEDTIELVGDKRTDAYQVYDKMIDRCNSEISKLILGETGTMDEKSFVGSAEVHERVLDTVEDADENLINGVLKYQLIPFMNNLGMGFEGLEIKSKSDDELDLEQKGKFDIELIKTGKYMMSPEYIKEKYNTEVEVVQQNSVSSVQAKLTNIYG